MAKSPTDPITVWAPETIIQTTFERLKELIRAGGLDWVERNNPDWRGKPWMDGILVDLDETDVVECIARFIIEHRDPSVRRG